MIILNRDDFLVPWIEKELGINIKPATALGFAHDGKLLGVVAYHNWQPQYKSVEASLATISPRWATRGGIRMMLYLPFQNFGAERIQLTIAKRNKAAQNSARRLGFVYEGKGRRAFGDDDACVYSMLKDEYEMSPWYVDQKELEAGYG